MGKKQKGKTEKSVHRREDSIGIFATALVIIIITQIILYFSLTREQLESIGRYVTEPSVLAQIHLALSGVFVLYGVSSLIRGIIVSKRIRWHFVWSYNFLGLGGIAFILFGIFHSGFTTWPTMVGMISLILALVISFSTDKVDPLGIEK